nr:cytochrome c oxidase subunit II [Stenocladius sp. 2 XYG-2023a]
MSTWSMINTQDSISPIMEQLTFFHDHTMMILVMITLIVLLVMMSVMMNKMLNRMIMEKQMIEVIWTLIPSMTLMFIVMPSLQILYLMEEINYPSVSVKSMGNQWFWSYELSDFKNIEFDSYMMPTNKMNNFSFRLLDVDNRLILPMNSFIRMMISSTDVIHSWTIPCIGMKIDATPGRLNQIYFNMNRPGMLFGQCSEICGTNHSFMPIVIESILPKYFIKWVKMF